MTVQPEPMVTGDAVVLDIQIAQVPVRLLAAVIDVTVMFILYVLGFILWALVLSEMDDAFAAATLIIFTVLAFVGYPVAFEVATRGRSLGKMALGLRVVSDDGGPERFRQAVFRALASIIEIWLFAGGPAVICSVASPKGKRIGDIFAGTVVISERAPELGAPPPMPPQLAWWASSLQLSGLDADQAERARQFLGRASQLDPIFRDRMAQQIYADVMARISPPPPPGTPVPLVLAAVLAERHRRELARLQNAPRWTAPRAPIAVSAPHAPQPAFPAAPSPWPSSPIPPPYSRPADPPPTPHTTPTPSTDGFSPPD